MDFGDSVTQIGFSYDIDNDKDNELKLVSVPTYIAFTSEGKVLIGDAAKDQVRTSPNFLR